MKNKKLLTNILFAVVILAIAAVLLVVRRVHASGSGLRAELIYGDNNTTMNLPLEDFYAGAKDADVLIYNSAIEGTIASVSQLTEKFPLLAEFKAVQNGQVWCTSQSLFQQSMELADLILDMNKVFTEGTPAADTLKFLTHVD